MKKLGELYASSLKAGDFIRLRGFEQKIVNVSVEGSVVIVETKMFEPVRFDVMEKVTLYY